MENLMREIPRRRGRIVLLDIGEYNRIDALIPFFYSLYMCIIFVLTLSGDD